MEDLRGLDVFILCGGLGNRLRTEIGQNQKVMAEVNGRPFLDLILEYLYSQGFRRVILGLGFKAESLEQYYLKNNQKLEIEFSREEKPLGTGGAVKNVCFLIRSDHFFALNGDCFCPVDFQRVLNFHLLKKALATIVVARAEEKDDFGSVVINENDKIEGFLEKSKDNPSQFFNAGIYCFKREVFDSMPSEESFSIERDFFPKLVGNEFFGYSTKEKFLDIGTPQRLKEAREKLRSLK